MPMRVSLEDTPLQAIVKLSAGNTGAAVTLAQLMKHGPEFDPDCNLPIIHVLIFDDMDIVGSHIYTLFSACGKDIHKLLALLRAHQFDFVSTEVLQREAAKPRPEPFPNLDTLISRVEEQLPNFKRVPK